MRLHHLRREADCSRARNREEASDLRVPNSHFDPSIVNFHGFHLEINANGRLHRFENVIGKSEKNATFSDSAVANKKNLESFIEFHECRRTLSVRTLQLSLIMWLRRKRIANDCRCFLFAASVCGNNAKAEVWKTRPESFNAFEYRL